MPCRRTSLFKILDGKYVTKQHTFNVDTSQCGFFFLFLLLLLLHLSKVELKTFLWMNNFVFRLRAYYFRLFSDLYAFMAKKKPFFLELPTIFGRHNSKHFLKIYWSKLNIPKKLFSITFTWWFIGWFNVIKIMVKFCGAYLFTKTYFCLSIYFL